MKSIKLNALAYMGIRVLNIIFPILTGTYVARVLDRTDYGYFNSVDTILSFFLPFATYGVYSYGLRAISNVKDNKRELNKVFSSLFYLCVVCTILTSIVYLFSYPLFFNSNPVIKKIFLVMGVQLIAQIFSIEWVNEALENYSFLFYKTAFIRVLMLISIFVFVRNEHDIVVYTLIMSLSTLINYLISYFWIKKDIKFVKVSLGEFKPLFLPLTAMLIFANANMLFTFLDRLFLVKTGVDVNVSYYTIAQRIVTVIAGVVTGAIGVSVPRLSYYLGIGKKEEYVNLVNRGSRIFNFFIIPFRTIILALDTILGSQILFTNGFEKRITVYTIFAGGLNLVMDSLLYFNNIITPEYYLITTMISESFLLILYVIFIHKTKLISLGHIFKYTLRYSLFASTFVPIYFLVNLVYPVKMVINLSFLINMLIIIFLSAISYISLLVWTKDSIFYEFLGHFVSLKRRIKKS